jgi:hypothetical protein
MTQIEIPCELPIILRNFTLSILRTKPHDIINHAVEYFTQLQQQQREQTQIMTGNNSVTTVPFSTSASISHYDQQRQAPKYNALLSGQDFIARLKYIVLIFKTILSLILIIAL